MMKQILVIEDQPEVRCFLKVALSRAGFGVTIAENGREGIVRFLHRKPDMIITDIFMPGNDGLEVIRTARQSDPALPIIAISGGTPMICADYLPVATEFGATVTLTKPILPTVLLETVSSLIGTAH